MTAISKSELPCCGFLNRCENEPDHPIKFSAETNEYRFVHPTGSVLIYHCPLCGGRGPKSSQSALFSELSEDERRRVLSLVNGLTTFDEVMKALGRPDRDVELGAAGVASDLTSSPTFRAVNRVFHYSRLSEVANVDVQVSSDGTVHAILLRGKQLPGGREEIAKV